MGDALSEEPVGAHRGHDVVSFRRNYQVLETVLLAELRVFKRRFGELFGKGEVGPSGKLLVERAGVNADSDGDVGLTCRIEHGNRCIESTDVPRIDAELGGTAARCLYRYDRIEVDVSHDGEFGTCANFLERVQACSAWYCHAHDLASRLRKPVDLAKVLVSIIGGRVEHRLHGDGCSPAHRHVSNQNAPGQLVCFCHVLPYYQFPKINRWISWFIITMKKSVKRATPANER